MSNAKDDNVAPSWLDKAFIEKILSVNEGHAISLLEFSVINAVGKGENYGSMILRVHVRYVQEEGGYMKEISLIVKSLPTRVMAQHLVVMKAAFAKEDRMYRDTLPAMSRLIKEKAPQEPSLMVGARAFSCSSPHTLVFEDLKQKGFRMANRLEQLDLSHALLVLNTLGRFHGVSVALHIQDPKHMDSYPETMYVESQRKMLDGFLTLGIDSLGNVVATWPGYEKYGEKLKTFSSNATSRIIEVIKPKENSLSVLNHGDCWMNNSLFAYNDQTGEVEDVRLVDFQLARYTSPAIDLIYFLYSSVQVNVLMESFDEMLEAYHNSLGTTLRLLGYEDRLLSMTELKKDIKDREVFGLMVVCTVLCAVLNDPSELTEQMYKPPDTSVMGAMQHGKRFKNALQKLLPLFEKKGLL